MVNLVKQYNENNTLTVTIVTKNGEEIKKIDNVSLEGSRGLLVVTVDDNTLTYEDALGLRESISNVISSPSIETLVVPSTVKIEYIKF